MVLSILNQMSHQYVTMLYCAHQVGAWLLRRIAPKYSEFMQLIDF